MKRELLTTSDGSTTIYLQDLQETYHSKHGAIQEAKHVFIANGLQQITQTRIEILEIGFGTGLNAFITMLEAQKNNLEIHYTAIEAYPISQKEVLTMNFASELNASELDFLNLHTCNWEEKNIISKNFSITKRKLLFQDIAHSDCFDLIYFDAFGYRVQPELWSAKIFDAMYKSLQKNGILVTYAARSIIKKNMLEAGFVVKQIPGPPGKREMTIAFKN